MPNLIITNNREGIVFRYRLLNTRLKMLEYTQWEIYRAKDNFHIEKLEELQQKQLLLNEEIKTIKEEFYHDFGVEMKI